MTGPPRDLQASCSELADATLAVFFKSQEKKEKAGKLLIMRRKGLI